MLHSQLEDLILAAFIRAEAEGHRDAAEHLMRALEALCPCPNGTAPAGSALARAYGHLAREEPPAARSRAGDASARGSGRKGRKGGVATGTPIRPRGRRR